MVKESPYHDHGVYPEDSYTSSSLRGLPGSFEAESRKKNNGMSDETDAQVLTGQGSKSGTQADKFFQRP